MSSFLSNQTVHVAYAKVIHLMQTDLCFLALLLSLAVLPPM